MARPFPRGFTLVEMLVVVVIVSILASIALPLAELESRRQREVELRANLRQIRDALDAYKRAVDQGRIARKADESGYPTTLDDLVDGITDQTDPQRRRIYFLRRVPRDPFAQESLAASATWGTRSYESPPDDPKRGRDIYDVHSLSTDTGINGVPYRKW